MRKKVEIWTDGACSGNPGPGGYAAILVYKSVEKTVTGGLALTTNNVMEITAVIEGLGKLTEKCDVNVYSDSNYVVNAVEKGWLESWQKNGFRTADNKPVKNIALWEKLAALLAVQNVRFIKVKGHAENENNNRCDALARGEIDKIRGANQ